MWSLLYLKCCCFYKTRGITKSPSVRLSEILFFGLINRLCIKVMFSSKCLAWWWTCIKTTLCLKNVSFHQEDQIALEKAVTREPVPLTHTAYSLAASAYSQDQLYINGGLGYNYRAFAGLAGNLQHPVSLTNPAAQTNGQNKTDTSGMMSRFESFTGFSLNTLSLSFCRTYWSQYEVSGFKLIYVKYQQSWAEWRRRDLCSAQPYRSDSSASADCWLPRISSLLTSLSRWAGKPHTSTELTCTLSLSLPLSVSLSLPLSLNLAPSPQVFICLPLCSIIFVLRGVHKWRHQERWWSIDQLMVTFSMFAKRKKERRLVKTGSCCSAVFLWMAGLVNHTPLHLHALKPIY